MREIKFRVWNTETNKMITNVKEMGVFALQSIYSIDEFLVIPTNEKYPLMQYTGLRDKNNIEIYEGDIVIEKSYPFFGNAHEIIDSNQKCDELNYVGVVVWDDGYYVDLKVVSNRCRGSAIGNSLYDYTELEVIGNIYENSHLLNNNSLF